MGDMTLHTTGYGRPALELLRDRVAAAKAGDPLRPVSIVVPTNYVGVSTRRLLAGGDLAPAGGRGRGIVGLSVLTVYRLAELLGAPALAADGRRPVSTPVVAAAIRRVLSEAPGLFAEVAAHPSTEEGLVRVHRELSEVGAASLDRLADRSERAADVVRIHRAVRALLQQRWFAEVDLMAAATAAVRDGAPVLDDVGTLIVHLPQYLSPPGAGLLRAVGQQQPVEVVAGRTGVATADAEVDTTLRRLGLDPTSHAEITAPAPTRVISVSDPEEEVRSAVEEIIDASRRGIPLEAMAVLYPSGQPYARLAHEQLTAAGIPYNGRAVRPLTDRVLGRWLLDLLLLPQRGFSRPAVMGLIGAAPMRGAGGALVAAGAWERLSREAGIVRGRREWSAKLRRLATDMRLLADREAAGEEPRSETIARRRDSAERAEALGTFVEELFERLASAEQMTSWRALSDWCADMVTHYLGDERRRAPWPDVERKAAERVEEALDRLAGLDAIEEVTDLDVFRRTLELELDADLGRVGQLGSGVLVGTTSAALGVDLRVVVVLGLAEGVCPTRPREDSLLSDAERAAAGDELRCSGDRTGVEHHHLLAALAAARDTILVFPRGDQRRSIERVPSRWLLDGCESVTGQRELPTGASWHRFVPSFAHRMTTVAFPATAQQYTLRALHGAAKATLATHPAAADDVVLQRGLELLRNRGGDTFSRFDGDLGAVSDMLPSPAERVMSATQLESWLSCPHAYLLKYVLRVEPVENPEELLEIDALERGSLVHDVLEAWLLAQIDAELPRPDEPWSAAARRQMRAIAEEHCDKVDRRGVTGHPLLWRRDRQRIVMDLERFVAEDDERRRALRLTPVAAEMPFGMPRTKTHPETDPLTVDLADGSSIRVRGKIDRVDRADDGTIVVADYKTGGVSRYRDLNETRPLADGTKLQLGLYGLAVADAMDAASVRSEYWFTSTGGEFKRKGYAVTTEVADQLRAALRIAVDGMVRGLFPLKPPEPNGFRGFTECQYCDPDDLGTTDRYREWESIRRAPRLRNYVAYIDPAALEEEAS